ncbi:MFS transporter [Vibrio halioticoli]|uniref:MFS transporter n=1 Tax=Vibrio halioticoli TaxID=71388 RepID=UPI000E5A611D|nr:MFS transporter [Vibrio halioticoli]
MDGTSKRNLAVLMYVLVSLGGIVVDIIVPSLPSIQAALASNEALTQWVFSAAILGFGVGQIIAGFVVDAFGRKMPMLIGCIVLILALFISAIAPSIDTLIGLRLLQGLAVSFIAVGGRAAIKDLFDGEEYLRAVNWITISFALGLTLSPFIGGYIDAHFGWNMVFYALMVWVAMGTGLLLFMFTDTHRRTRFSAHFVTRSFSEIVGNATFRRVALICGILYSILPAFNTVAPFLIQTTLGHTPIFYGHVALLLGASWLVGNIANRFFFKVPAEKKIRLSMLLSLISVACGLFYQTLFGLNLLALVIPVALVVMALGVLFPLCLGQALAPFTHLAGIANALVFSACWLCTALVSFLASGLSSISAIPLLLMYAILLSAVALIFKFKR